MNYFCRLIYCVLFGIGIVVPSCISAQEHWLVNNVSNTAIRVWASDVCVQYPLAYLCSGQYGLVILDIADPQAPFWVGGCLPPWVPVLNGFGEIALSGDFVYLAGDSGLVIYNVSDPFVPHIVGTYRDVSSWCGAVTVAGDYAYFTSGWTDSTRGIMILNVSDPTNPVLVTRIDILSVMRHATVWNDYLYVTTEISNERPSELVILNIANPADPVLLNRLPLPGLPTDIVVSNNYLYISGAWSPLQIYRLNDPTNPTNTGQELPHWPVGGIAVVDNRLFIATDDDHWGVVDIYDVTDPSHASQEGSWEYEEGIRCLDASGNHIYAGSSGYGFLVVDISDPGVPARVGSFNTTGEIGDIALAGAYACLSSSNTGSMTIMDIADPLNPRFVGSNTNLHSETYGLAARTPYVFLAANEPGLLVFDVSTSATPVEVYRSNYEHSWPSTKDIALSGDYLYLNEFRVGIHVLDVSNPAQTVEVTLIPNAATGGNCTVNSRFLYAYAGNYIGSIGVNIYDISDPVNPTFSCRLPIEVSVLDATDDFLCLINQDTLTVYSISADGVHTYHGSILVGEGVTDVNISDHYTLLAASERGLRIIDLADSTNIHEVGYYNTNGLAYGLAVNGNFIYLADREYFGIYDWTEVLPVGGHSGNAIAQSFKLVGGYPNPFNSSTTIQFTLPRATRATIKVFDIMGREVRVTTDGFFSAGLHEVNFDGNGFASGVYFAKLDAGGFSQTQKLMLLK